MIGTRTPMLRVIRKKGDCIPAPLLNGKVTMKQLYARVHARSSLTTGDVMNAIDCLTQICGEELREGREVHIEGLGYFSPTLELRRK